MLVKGATGHLNNSIWNRNLDRKHMKMQLYHKMLEVEDNDAMTYIQCHEPNITKFEQKYHFPTR